MPWGVFNVDVHQFITMLHNGTMHTHTHTPLRLSKGYEPCTHIHSEMPAIIKSHNHICYIGHQRIRLHILQSSSWQMRQQHEMKRKGCSNSISSRSMTKRKISTSFSEFYACNAMKYDFFFFPKGCDHKHTYISINHHLRCECA